MANGCSFKSRFYFDIARTRFMVTLPTSGYLKIVDSSDPSLLVTVGVDRESGSATDFALKRTGEIIDNEGFDRIYITNTQQAGAWIDIICSQSKDDFDVSKGSAGVLDSIVDPVVVRGGNTLSTYAHTAGVAAAQIFAANVDRTAWSYYNNGTDTVYLIGNNTGTTATGTPVAPGKSASGTGTHAMWSISATAAQDGRVMEETKV